MRRRAMPARGCRRRSSAQPTGCRPRPPPPGSPPWPGTRLARGPGWPRTRLAQDGGSAPVGHGHLAEEGPVVLRNRRVDDPGRLGEVRRQRLLCLLEVLGLDIPRPCLAIPQRLAQGISAWAAPAAETFTAHAPP